MEKEKIKELIIETLSDIKREEELRIQEEQIQLQKKRCDTLLNKLITSALPIGYKLKDSFVFIPYTKYVVSLVDFEFFLLNDIEYIFRWKAFDSKTESGDKNARLLILEILENIETFKAQYYQRDKYIDDDFYFHYYFLREEDIFALIKNRLEIKRAPFYRGDGITVESIERTLIHIVSDYLYGINPKPEKCIYILKKIYKFLENEK